jgi:hypothetical protein
VQESATRGGGAHLANRLLMAGKVTPSPKPMAARVASSAGRLPAIAGVSSVKVLHTTAPPSSTALGLKRVAA